MADTNRVSATITQLRADLHEMEVLLREIASEPLRPVENVAVQDIMQLMAQMAAELHQLDVAERQPAPPTNEPAE